MAKTRLNGVVTSATTAEEGLPSSSSSSSFEEQQQQQHDAFLLSMTFGNSNFNNNNNCNCSDDECNTTYANAATAANNVPRSIREAVIDHNNARMKRQRRTQNGNNYSFRRQHQSRELVRRECGFALYRLALPVSNNSDPIIVEYRNNHRILYIHRLDGNTINDNNNRLYSIGEGIIGSAYEESTRKQLDWVRGTSYLLPKCTGIACGWVVRHGPGAVKDDDDDDDDDDETMSDNKSTDVSVDNDAAADAVIMYSLKISSNDLQSMIHALPTDDTVSGGTSPSTWVVKARELFLGRLSSLNAVEEKKMNKYDDDGDDVDIAVDESSLKDCIALSENETACMKLIIELAT